MRAFWVLGHTNNYEIDQPARTFRLLCTFGNPLGGNRLLMLTPSFVLQTNWRLWGPTVGSCNIPTYIATPDP